MSLLNRLGKIATTASLIGALTTSYAPGLKAQEPQPTLSQAQEQRISRKYPKEFGLTINNEPSSIVYTYLGTISSQDYNELFEKEKSVIDKATELTEKISGIESQIDLSSFHERFRIPDLTEEDNVDIYQVKPEIPITTIDGSQSAGEMFSLVTFVKSNKPEITSLEARINGDNYLEISVQATDKTNYNDQEKKGISDINTHIQGKLPPEDLTVLLGKTEQSDLSYTYTITDENRNITTIETTQDQYITKNPLNNKNLTIEARVKDEAGNETEKEVTIMEELNKTGIIFLSLPSEKESIDIYSIDENGTNLTNLTNSPNITEVNPLLSPNRNLISFYGKAESGIDIYVMDLNRKNIRNVTNCPKIGKDRMAWSPDGSKIVFTAEHPRDDKWLSKGFNVGDSIYIVDVNKNNEMTNLTNGLNKDGYLGATWSPDGNNIILEYAKDNNRRQGIAIVSVDESKIIDITSKTQHILDINPIWLPD